MPVPLYRIKLYGHSGSDTQLFCKSLATILDIDEDRARSLLRDTPATIREGIEKDKAEEFCKLLEPIRALCIVEPIDGEISEDGPSAAMVPTLLSASAEADDLKKKASLRSRIWMVALVVTTGAFLLFVVGGFIASFWNVHRHNRPPVTAPQGGPAESQPNQPSADAGPISIGELQAQIDALEATIESNGFRLGQAEEVRMELHRSYRSRNEDLEANALIIRDLKDQIRSDATQLRILQGKKRRMEAGSE